MNDSEAGTSGAVTDDFDVFLNHRGPDVKATFVAHLDEALRCAGFRPFLDARSLMKGNPALESIDQALDMAKVHVAVVSRGYAESKYCLNELVAIMRSGKPVVPVFYDVEPVDLRWVENGPFAEAFQKHQTRGRTPKKLQEWRDALAALAGVTGFRLVEYQRDEAKLKREVVNEVARLTTSNDPVEVDQHRVGLEGSTKTCIQALENMGARTGMLGLVGMGGVGKTTLAKEIYNHFVAQKKFQCMTFLEIHRDSSTSNVEVRPTWSRKLRKQLLWDLLRVQPCTSNDYSSWFKKVSTLGPVLIVVDDVHKLGQFEALIPFASHLHPSSRIIVTSRDQSIFNNVAGRMNIDHYLHDVSTLGSKETSMLFNWHAFHTNEAPDGYKELAKDVVGACDGLPLALKVIGSSLFDKRSDAARETIWPEAVHALRQSRGIMDVLRWSYDSLEEVEQRMFVDITCLFYGQSIDEALAYWRSCENCTSCDGVHNTIHYSLRNLIDKNLIACSHDDAFFKVHDLLMDLGQDIGRKAKSHIVNGKIAEATIMKKQGTSKTIALNLVGSRKRKFEAEDFTNMPNLHYLGLPDGCMVNGELKCISRELRWLRWRGMPYKDVPMDLNLSRLTSLDFSESSNLASIWVDSNGSLEGCPNLLSLQLAKCTSITTLPDSIGQLLQLQDLNLAKCTSITTLPDSIGQLLQLQDLNLRACNKLKRLPESIGQLQALKNLMLQGCTNLKALPNSIGQLSQLRHLYLDYCKQLEKLPKSIGQLRELTSLNLLFCTNLNALPDTIGALSNLHYLIAYNCTSLMKLPTSIRHLSNLERLALQSNAECEIFGDGNIGEAWTQLFYLNLHNCGRPASILDYGALKSLIQLTIQEDTLIELPQSIGHLTRLHDLEISCKRLQCLPKSIGDLYMLGNLFLWNCNNLKRLPKSLGAVISLRSLHISCCSIQKLPRSIGQLSQLIVLRLNKCKNLQKLPTSIKNLQGLHFFSLQDCGNIEAMGALTILQGLPIWGSTFITTLPTSLGNVSTLIVYGNKRKAFEYDSYLEIGATSQVLEEDESGFLKAYHDKFSGVTTLVRGIKAQWRY